MPGVGFCTHDTGGEEEQGESKRGQRKGLGKAGSRIPCLQRVVACSCYSLSCRCVELLRDACMLAARVVAVQSAVSPL